MRLLVHICCAPCFAAPYFHLKKDDHEIQGFWYNHNIHPFTEYKKRLDTLQEFAKKEDIPLIVKDEYELEKFLRKTAFREEERCRVCYYDRLKYTAIIAKRGNFDAFTTTLLYSKFQKHDLIKEIGESLAKEYGITFYYHDFREYWKEGIKISKERKMYRQQYCGCIYSERDRYLK
ncbi:MAG: epoxyqueuosine reductase QueH [Candidatus Cloacimonetes bacterium]|jgi:predicted adenine nucleotide alpha hydrolase (AANH) superfamily ATPase|nr:epoxyqueuosine reductase QueH [Candidatus Cloacimonadota bacterium]